MAVRIPVYERHVQLDSGSQTIPRVGEPAPIGKAIASIGNSMISVAAHLKAKQDSFDRMQMGQNVGLLRQQLQQIAYEEGLKFNPATEPIGALHDRINSRSQQAIQQFLGNAPSSLTREYQVHGQTEGYSASVNAGNQENKARNAYGEDYVKKAAAQIFAQVEANPDSAHAAVGQIRKTIADSAAASGLTPGQRQQMEDAYIDGIYNHALKGYSASGRIADGEAFARKFTSDRKAEDLGRVKQSVDPGRYETKLTPDEEKGYQEWKKKNAPNDSGQDYDLRGAYKAGVEPDPQTGHMPDTYKKPNHPTFSNESQYSKDRPDLAGQWTGPNHDQFVPPAAGITAPPTGGQAQAAAAGPQSQLNQKRIDQINKNPEVKAAIEKAAADNNLDPNVLKVFASIESSGNPKDVTGEHKGLFNLSKAEFGMNGGGNILDANDNAQAAAKVLAQKQQQLTQTLGRQPTPTELFMSHNQGLGGAAAHAQNPDQPAWKSMLQTKEGQDRIASDGQAGAEQWAKRAIDGNVASDITGRLYGGDSTKISSRDFTAITSTKVHGGNVDEAITNARMQEPQQPQRTIVASADGGVVSDTRSPAFVGGMNVGGPARAGPQFDESHGYTGSGRLAGVKTEPWLVDTVRNAARVLGPDYKVEIISSADTRDKTNTPWHPSGRAIDIQIYGPDGKAIPNEGPPNVPGWDVYEKVGAAARAYAQDKYPNQHLTWGGHFNTGTAFDRMHFQSGGNHARDFNPQQVADARTALQSAPQITTSSGATTATPTVQVAGPGAPTQGAQPEGGSKWDNALQTGLTLLDGSQMKATAIRDDMKKKLTQTLNEDVDSFAKRGEGKGLSPDLQKYYGTDKLSYDLVANRLGTGAALTWQENQQFAHQYYQATSNFGVMTNESIQSRLNDLAQKSELSTKDNKLYAAASKTALQIFKERQVDPAKAVQAFPDVRSTFEDALKNPDDPDKIKAYTDAVMRAQRFVGIPDAQATPITNEQARTVGAPIRDLANPTREIAGKMVVTNVIKAVGDDPYLTHQALNTVLHQNKASNDQSMIAAADLTARMAELHQPDKPVATTLPTQPQKQTLTPGDVNLMGYGGQPYQYFGFTPNAFDKDYDPTAGMDFKPGTHLIPEDYLEKLTKNPSEEMKSNFDTTYGRGAADYYLNAGKEPPPPVVTQVPEKQKQDEPPQFPAPTPDYATPDEQKPDDQYSGAL